MTTQRVVFEILADVVVLLLVKSRTRSMLYSYFMTCRQLLRRQLKCSSNFDRWSLLLAGSLSAQAYHPLLALALMAQ